MIDNLSTALHAFTIRLPMSFSVDETQLPKNVNLSTSFREPTFNVELALFLLEQMFFALSAST